MAAASLGVEGVFEQGGAPPNRRAPEWDRDFAPSREPAL